ncbi:MAG: DUF2871 domain-containing protein [Candidatus Saccharimonadales bacterium]
MKKLYYAAVMYAVLGLASGLFYREFTKMSEFSGYSELSVLHTHLLALGMMVMLIILALEKVFGLSKTKWFNLFYWHYNGGLLLTTGMMLVIGLQQVAGNAVTPMLAGMAGLGHILLTVAIAFLFTALGKRLDSK